MARRAFARALVFLAVSMAGVTPVLAQGQGREAPVDRWGRFVRTREKPAVYHTAPPFANGGWALGFPTGGGETDHPVPLVVSQEWISSVFGTGIGATGLNIADLDGDTRREIVAAASGGGFSGNSFWYILSERAGAYSHSWVSNQYAQPITSLRVLSADADSALEVCVGVGNSILVYDGSSRRLERTIATSASAIYGLSVADVDGDSALEFVFCDNSTLYIYDATTGAQEYRGAGYGGWDVAVGNVDADSDLEIVVGNDTSAGYVINGRTRAVEWTYFSGFGAYVQLGNIDQDDMNEIICAYRWYRITTFDADVRSPKFEITTSHDIDALKVVDVEGDGPVEIVYGDGQWGKVHVLEGSNGNLKWEVDNPEHGVTDVAFGNMDGDPASELAYGAGYSSTGPDYLYVIDTATRTTEWQSLDFSGPFFALDYGDVEGDGDPEILYGCFESESGYDDGLYFIHDARTKQLEYVSSRSTGSACTGLWRIRHANVDQDARAEIFITSSLTYDGIVICYDGITHLEQFRTPPVNGQSFRALAVADVDGDGALEIAASVYREHTGAPGTYLYFYDASNGTQEWRSTSLGSYWASLSLLRVGNVDGDPNPEVLVAEYDGQLFVYDGVTKIQQLQTADLNITALDVADLDGNKVEEIVIGDQAGAIKVLNPLTGSVTQTIGQFGARIDGLDMVNVTGTPSRDAVFCVSGRLYIRYVGRSGVVTWTGGFLATDAGANDGLLVADIDQDGRNEVFLNSGLTGVRVFEILPWFHP